LIGSNISCCSLLDFTIPVNRNVHYEISALSYLISALVIALVIAFIKSVNLAHSRYIGRVRMGCTECQLPIIISAPAIKLKSQLISELSVNLIQISDLSYKLKTLHYSTGDLNFDQFSAISQTPSRPYIE